MKKLILSAAAVLVFGFTNAQDMKFGVKAGLNVASISGAEQAKSLIGVNGGVFAEFKIADKFAVQPELLFSMQGAKFSYSNSFGGYTVSATGKSALNYLNIPVMAKYFVTEQLSLQAGPQIGILLSATDTTDITSNIPGATNESTSTDSKSAYNTTDFGLNFGAGYDITENITVDLRYNLGLSELAKTAGSTATKNNVFSVNLGYKF